MTAARSISMQLVKKIQRDYPGADELDLSHNEIQRIENLSVLRNLREIDLSSNRLSILDLNCFSNLPLLKTVRLSHNRISTVIGTDEKLAVGFLDLGGNPLNDMYAIHDIGCLRESLQELVLAETPLSTREQYRNSIDTLFPWLRILDGARLISSSKHSIDNENICSSESNLKQTSCVEVQASFVPLSLESSTQATLVTDQEAQAGSEAGVKCFVSTQTQKVINRSVDLQTDQLENVAHSVQTEAELVDKKEFDILYQSFKAMEQSHSSGAVLLEIDALKLRIGVLENDKRELLHENQMLTKQVQRNDGAVRIESLEKLIVAQERIVAISSGGLVSKDLLAAWRKQVYALMVQNRTTEILYNKGRFDLQRECEQLKLELKDRENKIEETLVATKVSHQHQRDFKNQVLDLQSRCESLQHEKASVESLLKQLAARYSKECYGIERIGDKIGRFQERLESLQYKLHVTRDAMNQSTVNSKLMLRKVTEAEQKNVSLVQEKFRLSLSLNEAKSQSQMHSNTISALNQSLDELQQSISEQYSTHQMAMSQAVEQISKRENEKFEQLRMDYDNLKHDHSKLTMEIHSLRKDLVQKTNAYTSMENSKVSYLEDRLQRKDDEVHTLRRERNALLGTLKDAERRGLLPGLGLVVSRPIKQFHDDRTENEVHTKSVGEKMMAEDLTEDRVESRPKVLSELASKLLEEEESMEESEDEDILELMLLHAASMSQNKRLC